MPAAPDARAPPAPDAPSASTVPPAPRAVLLEVVGGTVLAGLGIAAIELAATAVPAAGAWAGAAVAAVFLGLPLLMARLRGFSGDPLGIGRAPILPGLKLGLLAAVVIAVPFAAGYDLLATHVFKQTRFAGPGLLSYGEAYQGIPTATAGFVLVYEEGHGLAVANHTASAVVLRPAKPDDDRAPRIVLRPHMRHLLSTQEAAAWQLHRLDGEALPEVRTGAALSPLAAADLVTTTPTGEPVYTFHHTRGRSWLLWYLLSQLLVVALPEEAFFRGWVLGRLRAGLPAPHRMVLGVPFGAAHVLSALLFALIHLVVTPAPHRLLVFFPALLFAWLAERSRAIVAPVVHHALSNALLRVAARTYL